MIPVRELPEVSPTLGRARREGFLASLSSVTPRVREILDSVRRDGDKALKRYARELDHWDGPLEVGEGPWSEAEARAPPPLRSALERAAERIRSFHEAQRVPPFEQELLGGSRISLRFTPLQRVGIYAPGGKAPYPSTVLMTAIAARAAGVAEVYLATPPRQRSEPPGLDPAIAAAARIAKVDRVFLLGGAVAIGAFAYGTRTVPVVDKIVGPGNLWVTAAKREVYGLVGIDSLSGPSESLLIVDGSAPLDFIVREALAQIEHGPDSRVVIIATDRRLAEAVAMGMEQMAPNILSLTERGVSPERQAEAYYTPDLERARCFADAYAPESLFVAVKDLAPWARRPPACGALFLGPWSSVTFGDYVSGTNHVLPVLGTARFASGLTAYDFGRWLSQQQLTAKDARALAPTGITIAEAEGMGAHAEAQRIRATEPPGRRSDG